MREIKTLAEVEKEAIIYAVFKTGNVVKAAEKLKIGRNTIYRKLKSYGYIAHKMVDEIINSHIET